MEITDSARALRAVIHEFLAQRLQEKLEKLKPEDDGKRQKLEAEYQPAAWLESAAKRVGQIQLATHIVKPAHPNARGTNLLVREAVSELHGLVASCSMGVAVDDVVGNSAALDVYKFLRLVCDGETLLARVLRGDDAIAQAFSDDPQQGAALRASFATIADDCRDKPESHSLARQVYFPLEDGSYHLLSPLFPTSLIHRLQSQLREERFGDAAKAAREARRKDEPWHEGYCEYPNLAIRNFGGSNPQTVGQLNLERNGENWLLAAFPPLWQSAQGVRPPFGVGSVFEDVLGRRRDVLALISKLKKFLLNNAERNNRHIRARRAALVGEVCTEVLNYAAQLHELAPGWSVDARCKLPPAQCRWLDPEAEHPAMPNWQEEICRKFVSWFNAQLRTKDKETGKALLMTEDEAAQWASDFADEMRLFAEGL